MGVVEGRLVRDMVSASTKGANSVDELWIVGCLVAVVGGATRHLLINTCVSRFPVADFRH